MIEAAAADELVDQEVDEATSDILPSSPGLESLIEEKRVESNRLKKAEKFNEAWEAIRVCAESCARQSTPVFRENLENVFSTDETRNTRRCKDSHTEVC